MGRLYRMATPGFEGARYPDAPRAAVGAVVVRDGRVLLVLRRNPPSAGQWAIPGGRVRLGESLAAAAEREVLEETGVTVRASRPVFAFDAIDRDEDGRVRYHYVVVDLLAEHVAGEPLAQDDALEAAWLGPGELADRPVNATTRRLLHELLGPPW